MERVVIVIPAYEPDRRLLTLLNSLKENKMGPIILVDDGSGSAYDTIFSEAYELIKKEGELLAHEVNKGKGRALKTAFDYILSNFPGTIGVVTADSDGQHTAKAIQKIKEALCQCPNSLILGVRSFDGEGIPWKSRFGNNLTEKVFQYLSGVHVSDTQTGLRGIPRGFLRQLMEVKGERFEFEMRMLLECAGRYKIVEVPIETIYDSESNHQTHFHPIMDSMKIYRILGEKFFRYIFSSFSSSIIDIIFFWIFCVLLKSAHPKGYIALSTVVSRVISATYNYIMNYKLVFHSNEAIGKAGVKYAALAIIQMGVSAALVTFMVNLVSVVPEVAIKVVVDVTLFFISYFIQQQYIFSEK